MLLLTLLAFFASTAAVEAPRIGCWHEPDGGAARFLYGIPGNLIVTPSGEEACENRAAFSEPDDAGVRMLRIAPRWQLAESSEGERYLLYRETTRYELPQQ